MGSNGSTPSIEVVAFDGDDTLWHSESHFVDAHQRFCALLAPYVDDPARIDDQVIATERQNLDLYGYGSKAFTLSLIETAIMLTEGRVTADEISAILELGKRLLDHPVELLDGVEDVVDEMAASGRRLIIVTCSIKRPRWRDRGWPTGSSGSRSCPRRTSRPTAG